MCYIRSIALLLFVSCLTAASATNITVIGIGRLGLCLALCLEKAGYDVLGVDASEDYVGQINAKTYSSSEPLVTEYLQASTHFRATTSLKEGIAFADIYCLVVPTNSIPGMQTYDHSILSHIIAEINRMGVHGKQIIIHSTVFPGYIAEVRRSMLDNCTDTVVSYNPEFIAQGNIIRGLENPDVVLIGEGSQEAGDVLEEIYAKVCADAPHVARMSAESAEIAKLALNCFITSKIAFANLVGDIADATPGADKYAVLEVVGADSRVGKKCLQPGYGFGGPCFPRDNQALGNYASLSGIDPALFRAITQANREHAERMAAAFLSQGLDEYVFEDVCYKPGCPVPIIEESQKLEVAKKVALEGKRVVIRDRHNVIERVQNQYGDLFIYEITDQ
jgi:UDPglucose 6-dehydrogenase